MYNSLSLASRSLKTEDKIMARGFFQSNFTEKEVKIGKKFSFQEREWEVTLINKSNFNAKTINNTDTQRQIIAQFKFRKEEFEN